MVTLLTGVIQYCSKIGDFTTRYLFEDMVADEDGHIDCVETQQETIKQIGLENYLREQIKNEL